VRATSFTASERLVVGRREVARAFRLFEPRVLRADARVVEPGADRVGLLNLPSIVAEHVADRAVQNADAAGR
jgi:hypothetical protein